MSHTEIDPLFILTWIGVLLLSGYFGNPFLALAGLLGCVGEVLAVEYEWLIVVAVLLAAAGLVLQAVLAMPARIRRFMRIARGEET